MFFVLKKHRHKVKTNITQAYIYRLAFLANLKIDFTHIHTTHVCGVCAWMCMCVHFLKLKGMGWF